MPLLPINSGRYVVKLMLRLFDAAAAAVVAIDLVTLFCIGSYLFLYRETAVLFFVYTRGSATFLYRGKYF